MPSTNRQLASYLAPLACLVLPAVVFADSFEDGFLTEQDLFADIPVVSSVTGLEQNRADTPASITIIDRDLIRTSGAVELADVFRLVPGMQVYHVNGSRFGVSMHGQTNEFPQRLEVRVDGRSVYLPMLSTIDWASLGVQLDDIDHIEVVRGSNVPAQGANAFQGSINIVTRNPLQHQGTSASYTGGGEELHNFSIRHAGDIQGILFEFTASHKENDGFSDLRDGRDSEHFTFSASYSPSLADQIDFRFGISNSVIGVGDGDDPAGFADIEFDDSYQQLDWQHNFSDGDRISLHAYHNRTNMDDRTSLGLLSDILAALPQTDFGLPPPPPVITIVPANIGQVDQEIFVGSTDNRTDRYELGFDHTLNILQDYRLFWGASYRLDRLQSRWLLDGGSPVYNHQKRLFGNLEWRVSRKLTTNIGLMYENDDLVDTKLSSRLALNYHLLADHTVRFSATRAHRSPSLLEAKRQEILRFQDGSSADIQFVSNPTLAEEDLDSLELGYYGRWPQKGVELDLKLYHEIINNGIDAAKTRALPGDLVPPAQINSNISNVRTHGLDAQFQYRPDAYSRLLVNYGYAVPRGQRVRAANDISTLENRVPRHTFSMLASHRFDLGFEGSIAHYRMSPVKWLGGADLFWQSRTDLVVGIPLSDHLVKGDISFVVQNVFAEDYLEYQDNNNFERRSYFRVNIEL